MSIQRINYHVFVFAFISLFLFITSSQAAVINEIRIDQTGADTDEFFELYGTAGESLDNLSYLVIGDQSRNQGYIESVIDLSGYQIATDGFFLVTESSFSLLPDVDLFASLNFENNDNVTHMLVRGFTGNLRDDIDANDDGLIDNTLWSDVVDSLSLLATTGGGDLTYAATNIGPQNNSTPNHVYRSIDQTGTWIAGDATAGTTDNPRVSTQAEKIISVPEPSSLLLLMSGLVLPLLRKTPLAESTG